ncbi:UNVERIFIED_CONTAM: hypothetical protein GTU68_027683 [Idotea baltica]|nr:hypothetical protein [Idotea baltica]
MDIKLISPGSNAPEEVNVVIEIPMNSGPIKYEYDLENDTIAVDRFMPTSMSYPCNYGFVPNTLSGDGDPADVLVYSRYPIVPGALIKARPIGVLMTEDESGMDAKILAVPAKKTDPFFAHIEEYTDLPELVIGSIEHFFENYKKLEKGKWVKVSGWESAKKAKQQINESIAKFEKKSA